MNSQTNQLTLEDATKALEQSTNKFDCLKLGYNIISERYYGDRLYTISHWPELFKTKINYLWQSPGVMHCTNINRLLTFLLLTSGLFYKNDIKKRWTLLWFISPHQYLEVNTEQGIIKIDIWAKNFGIKFGDYAHGWHLKTK